MGKTTTSNMEQRNQRMAMQHSKLPKKRPKSTKRNQASSKKRKENANQLEEPQLNVNSATKDILAASYYYNI